MQIGEISRRQQLSVKYLEQFIRPLKQAQLVTSGDPKGGHLLAQKPESITSRQVVRLFEGHTDLVECVSHPEKCTLADDCQIRLAWREATRPLFEKLDATTIADRVSQTVVENPIRYLPMELPVGTKHPLWRDGDQHACFR